jgi:hypothetical protein
MMILLSQAEYNKLVQRASVVEAEVERRLEEERDKLYAHIANRLNAVGSRLHTAEDVVKVIRECLR